MERRAILIFGTGALAQAIVHSLSISFLPPLDVHLYSRDFQYTSWLATVSNIRSVNVGNSMVFTPHTVNWDCEDFFDNEFAKLAPKLLLNTASLQSNGMLKRDTIWSRLIRSAGYGVSLPLQCPLTLKISRAIIRQDTRPLFINCCYPDGVNVVLRQLGLDIFCGIGNIGIIELMLSMKKDLCSDVMLLANHQHVQELFKIPEKRKEMPRLWCGQKEVKNIKGVFDTFRLYNDSSLNRITALNCIKLINTILTAGNDLIHLPGPMGFAGGYPVQFHQGNIKRVGTGIIDFENELSWNLQILQNEGLEITQGGIYYSNGAKEKLNEHSKELAKGFVYADADDYIKEFQIFKERLDTNN